MSFFKPSPERIQLQEEIQEKMRARMRAMGRGRYIFYNGILAWGLPIFALSSILEWYQKYGWQIPSSQTLHLYWVLTPLRLAIWLSAGYFFGARMWRRTMRVR